MAEQGLCIHRRKLCSECIIVDDCAKRAYDGVTALVVAHSYDERMRQSPWVAISLTTGSVDSQLYDRKRDAVRAQLHEQQCAYFCFRNAPNGFDSAKDAALYLAWNRAAYDAGMRLPDPDEDSGGPDLIMPTARETFTDQLRRLIIPGRN